MKYFLTIFALGFLIGCDDKDDDTGADTAEVVDTNDSEHMHPYMVTRSCIKLRKCCVHFLLGKLNRTHNYRIVCLIVCYLCNKSINGPTL